MSDRRRAFQHGQHLWHAEGFYHIKPTTAGESTKLLPAHNKVVVCLTDYSHTIILPDVMSSNDKPYCVLADCVTPGNTCPVKDAEGGNTLIMLDADFEQILLYGSPFHWYTLTTTKVT